MEFMSTIMETESNFKRIIKEYHGQHFLILGGGAGAKGIIRYLKDNGISDFRVCVDQKYWKEGQFIEGIIVEPFEKVMIEAIDKYDLIVGFFDFHTSQMAKYKEMYPETINSVIYDDIFPHFWMEPQIFVVDRDYYERHDAALTELDNRLEDDHSRKVLRSFIEQRISGNYKYSEGVISPLKNEYFEPDLLKKKTGLCLVDCGGFDGEDTKRFFDSFTDDLFSFVIEPDKNNLELIRKNLKDRDGQIKIIDKAIWNEDTILSFSSGGREGSGISDSGEEKVESICLDSLYSQYKEYFDNKTVIVKMDIEGTELKALQGAKKLIAEMSPILVICVYHKPEDIIELPQFVLNLDINYSIYLRRYFPGFRDTVMYAIPRT